MKSGPQNPLTLADFDKIAEYIVSKNRPTDGEAYFLVHPDELKAAGGDGEKAYRNKLRQLGCPDGLA